MRTQRNLSQDAWYEVRTAVNNRKPLFRRRQAMALLFRVLGESRGRFTFRIRGLRLTNERLSFYIKPANGLQLPAIMQWLKQTFAVRFNGRTGRTGHIWGDRYWSRIVEDEPPEWAEEVDWKAIEATAKTGIPAAKTRLPTGVSPLLAENPAEPRFSPKTPFRSPSPSG